MSNTFFQGGKKIVGVSSLRLPGIDMV